MWIAIGIVSCIVALAAWSCLPPFGKRRVDGFGERARSAPILAGAEPVARTRQGNTRALLCIHGFPASPRDFAELADAALERGFDVYAPLWPGCGTTPADILRLTWDEAYAAMRRAYVDLASRYDKVFLVGQSMGGTLALALAEEFCPGSGGVRAPSGIATIGAPVVLNSLVRYGMVKSPLLYFARALGLVVPSIGARLPDPVREGKDGDGRWIGYLGMWPSISWSLWMGVRSTWKALPRVTCPALVMHCRSDRVIDFRNAGIIQSRIGSRAIRGYTANMDAWDHQRHSLLLYDSERTQAWTVLLVFFDFIAK
jgi:carboxylesterase